METTKTRLFVRNVPAQGGETLEATTLLTYSGDQVIRASIKTTVKDKRGRAIRNGRQNQDRTGVKRLFGTNDLGRISALLTDGGMKAVS